MSPVVYSPSVLLPTCENRQNVRARFFRFAEENTALKIELKKKPDRLEAPFDSGSKIPKFSRVKFSTGTGHATKDRHVQGNTPFPHGRERNRSKTDCTCACTLSSVVNSVAEFNVAGIYDNYIITIIKKNNNNIMHVKRRTLQRAALNG